MKVSGRKRNKTVETEDSLVGAELEKYFVGHGLQQGTVKSFNNATGFYRVAYKDGDEEDLSFNNIITLLNAQAVKDKKAKLRDAKREAKEYEKEINWPKNPEKMVGAEVKKKFGRKNYEGKIVRWNEEKQWFRVEYSDGDAEDIGRRDYAALTILSKATTKKAGRPAKAKPAEKAVKAKSGGVEKKRGRGRPAKAAKGASASPKPQSESESDEPAPAAPKRGRGRPAKDKKTGGRGRPAKGKAKEGATDDPKMFMSRAVRKQFGKQHFDGIVERYKAKDGWFLVKYDDGDTEELTLSQLKKILVD